MDAALRAVEAADLDSLTVVSTEEGPHERVAPNRADRLLGQTREAVVVDCFENASPNVIGRTVGTVAGGGLYLLVVPEAEPVSGGFRESLAVPPFETGDVRTAFDDRLRARFAHPGVAVYDADTGQVVRDGATEPADWSGGVSVSPPRAAAFPAATYRACRTVDQKRAVVALERLSESESGSSVVIEANRGRGKSTAAGFAAAALAASGAEVAVTAPSFGGARTLLSRAAELVASLGETAEATDRTVSTTAGGTVRYHEPAAFESVAGAVDAAIVDEAAGLSVARLEAALAAPAAAFVTTIHGYEGAGRGFSVRFRDRLADSAFDVTDCRLRQPIRHAPGDPVESWSFRTLALDARPPVAQVIADATPQSVTYRRLKPAALADDERLLREAFGSLVEAHYRTEPDDLARLLDAPNLTTHALCHDGHVVSVALVAREGGFSPAQRESILTGGRIAGNLLPDLLTSQLRDPAAGEPVGYRVVRIATHQSRRGEGFASRLLDEIHRSLAAPTDGPREPTPSGADRLPRAAYLGTAFGATPGLVAFWHQNGYRTVHLSTTRGDASGEYSAVMVRPATAAGERLATRHGRRFRDRIGGVLLDSLADAEPDTVRAVLAACGASVDPLVELSDADWQAVVAAAYGPGLFDPNPTPFRRLGLAWLVAADPAEGDGQLSERAERLVVRRVLQANSWEAVAEAEGYDSAGVCRRALGRAYQPIVERFGGAVAARERQRYE